MRSCSFFLAVAVALVASRHAAVVNEDGDSVTAAFSTGRQSDNRFLRIRDEDDESEEDLEKEDDEERTLSKLSDELAGKSAKALSKLTNNGALTTKCFGMRVKTRSFVKRCIIAESPTMLPHLLSLLYFVAVWTVAASIAPRSYFSNVRTPQSPTDPVISDAANFAVDQLRALSDSGIYTTLSLTKIHAAATELGDFHYVIHLQVGLASPYFKSKREVEEFEMMVLESKPRVQERAKGAVNTTRSIAIDEFPELDEDAIELFWEKMVEERRQRRRELFVKWEREGDEGENVQQVEKIQTNTVAQTPSEKVTKTLTIEELQRMPTKQLRQLLATPESTAPLRAAISAILDERLTLLEQREEDQQQPPQLNLHRDEL